MKIQKLTALALALALLFALAACGAPAAEAPAATDAPVEATEAPAEPTAAPVAAAEEAAEAVTVRLAALTGPTAMGMAKVFSDADAGTAANSYEYALYGAAVQPVHALVMMGEYFRAHKQVVDRIPDIGQLQSVEPPDFLYVHVFTALPAALLLRIRQQCIIA